MTLAGLPLDERQMTLKLIAKLQQRLMTPDRIRELDETEAFPEDIVRELLGPNVGLQLLFIPEEYGGMSGGARDIAAVSEALSKICLGISTAFLAIHLGADPILVGGTPEQKQKWLGKIAEEGNIVAYAVTEPEAGSNLSNLKTTAEPVPDETGAIKSYRINGSKQFISNGGVADFLTVLAQTPEGPTFFIIERNTPGLKAGKPEVKHGIRCSNTAPLTLDDVIVPIENLVGGVPGKGLQQANEVFGYTRLMVAAFGLGAGIATLEKVIPYARQRIQFGTPLFEKQGYTHKFIIPHIVRLEAARAYIEEVAERLDSGEKDLQVEGSIAKYFASEAGTRCADDGVQALGGYGYITEYGIEKIRRDAKITTIYEGTSEIQQMIISTFRWKATIKSKGAYYAGIAQEMHGMEGRLTALPLAGFGVCIRALNDLIQLIHQKKLTRSQHIMFELADLITQIEVCTALVRKVSRLTETGSNISRITIAARCFIADTLELSVVKTHRILDAAEELSDQDVQRILAPVMNEFSKPNHTISKDKDQLLTYL